MRLVVAVALAMVVHCRDAPASPLPDALKPYRGKVIYLDFWASWCGPCAQSFGWLNEMNARYGSRIEFVGVDVDADPWAGSHFLAQHRADFAIVPDPGGHLAKLYALEGMPSTIILDGDGNILHRHIGFRSSQVADYESAIVSALNRAEVTPSK